MRVMLDANVLLDCLVLEASGEARPGKDGSERTLPIRTVDVDSHGQCSECPRRR